jgi:ADP-heptose:LPS heptosyltransferase
MKNLVRKIIKKLIRLRGRFGQSRPGTAALLVRPAKIAYFIAGGIGDGVMAFPAIHVLRQTYPDAQLDILAPPSKALILAGLFEGYAVRPLTPALVWSLMFRRGYDCAFVNTVAAFKVRIELAASRSSAISFGFHYREEDERNRLYTHSSSLIDNRHDIDQNIDLIAGALGINVPESARHLPLRRLHPHGKITSVIMHPGAEKGYEYKRWPVDRFRIIVRKLLDSGCAVTILAGPSEPQIGGEFAGMPATVLKDPDPDTLITSFRAADIFVGNDSGPAHLAAWFGLATITLIGPANPLRTAPRGERCISLSSSESCSPCHFSAVNCSHQRCMKNITVEQVWEAVEKAKAAL